MLGFFLILSYVALEYANLLRPTHDPNPYSSPFNPSTNPTSRFFNPSTNPLLLIPLQPFYKPNQPLLQHHPN